MNFSITPYTDDSTMKPWPPLASKAFCLKDGSGNTIFFYDCPPDNKTLKESDTSAPVFVLVHGLGDEADSWRHLIPLLNDRGFRVLALDLPGFGRSVVTGKVSFKNHAVAVLKLIEATVQTTPVFLAGNSMGAMIAEAAALQKPEAVRGLVLIDGSIPGGPANPGLFALAKMLFSRKWYRAYRGRPDAAWGSLYPYYADLDAMPQADKDFLRQRVVARVESPTQEDAYFASQRSLVHAFASETSRFAREIQQYKGKILLIWGEKDRLMPLSSAETFKNLREGIALELISGAGHLPHQEKPEETARLMAEFAMQENRHGAV